MASRSRRQYRNTDVTPRSMAPEPIHTRWLLRRVSSTRSTRKIWARSGDLTLQELLDGESEREVVPQGVQVVHAIGDGDALDVLQRLAGLINPRVQVADDGLAATDDLAVEVELKAQDAVGRRVLGTHVDAE